jgi:hypothetical protein
VCADMPPARNEQVMSAKLQMASAYERRGLRVDRGRIALVRNSEGSSNDESQVADFSFRWKQSRITRTWWW